MGIQFHQSPQAVAKQFSLRRVVTRVNPARNAQMQPRLVILMHAHQATMPSNVDPEKTRPIGLQLGKLLHAHQCQKRENQMVKVRVRNGCQLRFCSYFTNLLRHMPGCQAGETCTFMHCSFSKEIIKHCKLCTRIDCPVCLPLKEIADNIKVQTL